MGKISQVQCAGKYGAQACAILAAPRDRRGLAHRAGGTSHGQIWLAHSRVRGGGRQRAAVDRTGRPDPGRRARALCLGLDLRPLPPLGRYRQPQHSQPGVLDRPHLPGRAASGLHLRQLRPVAVLPLARAAGQDGSHPAIALGRAAGAGPGRRLETGRVPGLWLRLPRSGRAHPAVGRGRPNPKIDVDRAAPQLSRPPLSH